MRVLIDDLALLEPKYKHAQKLSEQVQGQTKGNGKAMASMTNQILNKDTIGDKGVPKGNPTPQNKEIGKH